jgi:hypothetical protein
MTEATAQTEDTEARRLLGLQECSAPGEPAGVTARRGKPVLPDMRGGLMSTLSHKVIIVIRDAVSSKDGWRPDAANGLPARDYSEKEFQGRLEMRPMPLDYTDFLPPDELAEQRERMWQQVGKFDDGMADTYDLLMAIYITQAATAIDSARCSLDDLLFLRGLKKNPCATTGRRGGYTRKQREAVSLHLYYLQNIWVDLGNVQVHEPGKRKATAIGIQSRLFIVTDCYGQRRLDGSIDPSKGGFIFQPGRAMAAFLLGPGRSTALMSVRALSYDPYRQKWEKRLCRYLAWQWRCRAREGNYFQVFSVRGLLEIGCREGYDRRRESWQRNRLERALGTLRGDGVIAAYQYDEDLRGWLDCRVMIEPPAAIPMHYAQIEKPAKDTPARVSSLGGRIAEKRSRTGLTLSQTAKANRISIAQLSRLERGLCGKQLAKTTRTKLEKWLSEGDV